MLKYKNTHLGELQDPFTKFLTIVLTIIVAGRDYRLLMIIFQLSHSVFINLIKFAFFCKIGDFGGIRQLV